MFDPTVYDNLKVAIENELYDLDNLDRVIDIVGRRDLLDMATLSRELILSFRLAGHNCVTAELSLAASLKHLSAEILEQRDVTPICQLILRFYFPVDGSDEQCKHIENGLNDIWQLARKPILKLSREFGSGSIKWNCTAELNFERGINEDQMNDLPELIQHMLRTLDQVEKLI